MVKKPSTSEHDPALPQSVGDEFASMKQDLEAVSQRFNEAIGVTSDNLPQKSINRAVFVKKQIDGAYEQLGTVNTDQLSATDVTTISSMVTDVIKSANRILDSIVPAGDTADGNKPD